MSFNERTPAELIEISEIDAKDRNGEDVVKEEWYFKIFLPEGLVEEKVTLRKKPYRRVEAGSKVLLWGLESEETEVLNEKKEFLFTTPFFTAQRLSVYEAVPEWAASFIASEQKEVSKGNAEDNPFA